MRSHDKRRRQRLTDLCAALGCLVRQGVVSALARQRPAIHALTPRRLHDFAVDGNRRRRVRVTRPQVTVRDVFGLVGLDRPIPGTCVDNHLVARRGRHDRHVLDDRNDRIGGLAHRIAVHDGDRQEPLHLRERRLERPRVDAARRRRLGTVRRVVDRRPRYVAVDLAQH